MFVILLWALLEVDYQKPGLILIGNLSHTTSWWEPAEQPLP